jgi:quercetin dioxygenase-like cupin family protein
MSLKGEVWIDHRPHGDRRQTLAPGAATPPHRHDCDESVLCVGGWGEVHSAGRAQRFGAETTVILPTDQAHQILNLGTMPLELVGIVGAAAVVTWLPDGAAIHLPWSS